MRRPKASKLQEGTLYGRLEAFRIKTVRGFSRALACGAQFAGPLAPYLEAAES